MVCAVFRSTAALCHCIATEKCRVVLQKCFTWLNFLLTSTKSRYFQLPLYYCQKGAIILDEFNYKVLRCVSVKL